MKVGILTGGGDCPGLNAVIRAVVRKGCFHYEDEFVGFLEGWRGLLEDKTMPLDLSSVGGILPRGGTILRTSRTNPGKKADGLEKCVATLKQHKVEALIAIGGDDTLSVAQKLHEKGVDVVGVPKTIDNDLAGTDFTFGFDTAVNIATEAIDRVHTTAEAHNRVMVVEVMGRDAGWIAMYSGIAGGADVILIPEIPFDVDKVAETIRLRHARGRYFSIVVVAEGAKFSTDVIRNTARPSWSTWAKTNSVTPGWAESLPSWPAKLSGAPVSKPAPSFWDTCSAAALPAPSTACWRPATAWERSTWSIAASLAAWRHCAATRSFPCPWQTPSPRIAPSTRKRLTLRPASSTS